MKRIDAGISGGFSPPSDEHWQDLDLAAPWPSLIALLAPDTTPRPIQVAALQTHRLLESRRNAIISAPTNSGKSLVGLLLLLTAIRNGQRAVLLEPLRALAREKADELAGLVSSLSCALGRNFVVPVSTGDFRLDEETMASPPPDQGELIIATPERLEAIFRNPAYAKWIESIGAVCVDEAHLLSTPHRGPTLEHLITSFLCLPTPPKNRAALSHTG
ncbi:MAG: DEAD/DEAH box helicase [Caldilineaceae bacterium]|nr:DEAD/DEAH box helicase [Caldilineaceae bacterium]